MARICSWYTESPEYQECLELVTEPGETRCPQHRVSKKRTMDLSTAARRIARERDGGRCRQCGKPGFEVDHIKELSEFVYGEEDLANHPDNLQLLCFECHATKTRAHNRGYSSVVDDNDFRTSARNRKRRRMREMGLGVSGS